MRAIEQRLARTLTHRPLRARSTISKAPSMAGPERTTARKSMRRSRPRSMASWMVPCDSPRR